VRVLKEQLENLRGESERAERDGDLGKAAEMEEPPARFSGFVGGRGGRAGLHTGALGLLLAEMQSVAREHPEGVW
ncbi:hypothetical protein Q6281_30790, partial [Klebsiella pneumoniae]|nr:hypothetical protein [Klebsiella pneumoniae]